MAVISRDDAIDPVGACVGLKGSRVQAVVNELGGERIDIVPWSPDPERFARLALAPARVAKVFSDPESKTIQAVVDEDQLSLAIGRNGQNVRLASELTGWKIDLYSSREWLERGGEGPLFAPLPPGGGRGHPRAADRAQGAVARADRAARTAPATTTLNDILDLEREDIAKIPGMTPETTEQLLAFLTELTDEDSTRGGPAAAMSGLLGLLGPRAPRAAGGGGCGRRCGRSCRRRRAGAWCSRTMRARARVEKVVRLAEG